MHCAWRRRAWATARLGWHVPVLQRGRDVNMTVAVELSMGKARCEASGGLKKAGCTLARVNAGKHGQAIAAGGSGAGALKSGCHVGIESYIVRDDGSRSQLCVATSELVVMP